MKAKTDSKTREAGGIQSLETGLSIAFSLARARRRLTLTEISAELGLLPSTVHRHLVSLARLGLVQQAEPNGRYELGPSAAEFGFAALRDLDSQNLWGEAISRIRDETGLTTLAVIFGTFGPTVIRWKASVSPVTMHVHLGAVLPLTTSASGHIFCAFHDKEEIEPLVEKEFRSKQRITHKGGVVDRASFTRLIERTRAERLAGIQGDLHTGVDSLSAPVFQADGTLQLALTILATGGAIDMSPSGPHASSLKAVADWLSRRLGHCA